jgi:mRNA interferase MazF
MDKQISRGERYYANLDPVFGSEQGARLPVFILSNNIGNRHSPTAIVAAITTSPGKPDLPVHVELKHTDGLRDGSIVLLEQIRTVDRRRLESYLGALSVGQMLEVERALGVSLGLFL